MTSWSARDVPDQSGRRVIVTGANSGLGYENALELARRGAQVLLACRDKSRGEAAIERLKQAIPDARVTLGSLDISDLDSVAEFAGTQHEPLDLLVNNAGVMALPHRMTTTQGFEMQFGTNHLGHFALTGRLLPLLLAQPGARIVTVASVAHRFGQIRFDDLDWQSGYTPFAAYGQSKLANLHFAFELDRRLRASGQDTLSVAAHPGYSRTHLTRKHETSLVGTVRDRIYAIGNLVAQSATAGALPTLRAATAPDVRGGEYYGPSGLRELRGAPKVVRALPKAYDEVTARRLWEVSTELTGVGFDALAG